MTEWECPACKWVQKAHPNYGWGRTDDHAVRAHKNNFCTSKWARVILFKPSGKYYTEEDWRIPENAIGPYDMNKSPDFRRISGGPVLIRNQEPWGYPHLLAPGFS